jgi:hypothetical protein
MISGLFQYHICMYVHTYIQYVCMYIFWQFSADCALWMFAYDVRFVVRTYVQWVTPTGIQCLLYWQYYSYTIHTHVQYVLNGLSEIHTYVSIYCRRWGNELDYLQQNSSSGFLSIWGSLFVLIIHWCLDCYQWWFRLLPYSEQDDDVAPKDVHLAVGEKQPVFRTSSAEKRRYCESKRSTSSSSSCSSDDELKELRDVSSLSGQRTHVRHKPPLKDRRIVSLATSKEAMFDSQDDDDVFTQNKSSYPLKRTKFTHRQPLSGRYTDFDKMRRTPLTQVPKARKVWRRELPSSCNNFARVSVFLLFLCE